ncbi:MAG: D-alanyl-D-alanine carboxypeptidase family protein [Clostridia bacterium]|nr:D-alanyl-D-alanine carboxypeptidase family protein [Clostridia bacterium]
MKKILMVLLALAMTAQMLAACGKKSDIDTEDTIPEITLGDDETHASDDVDSDKETESNSVDKKDPTETDNNTGSVTDAPDTEPGHVRVESITLDKYEVNIKVGETDMPWVTMLPEEAENKGEEWKSSDESVATVNYYGEITGVSRGECMVTVTSKDNPEVSATVKVTVLADETEDDPSETLDPNENEAEVPDGVVLVESITLDKYEVAIEVGASDMPWVTMLPENATDKSELWESSNTSVATVNSYGNITGVSEGECTVTVTSKDNPEVKAEVRVKVTAPTDERTYIDGILIANKTYALPSNYNPGIDPAAQAALDQMIAAAAGDGITLYVVSGFRSYSSQASIYNNYVARDGQAEADRYSARPGHSEHQTGLAFDLNSLEQSFGQTAEGKWLKENCYKYGFIIRYPENKESITGYMYEPWHVRYLGVDVATSVYNSGLCLEEYLGITSVYAD